jgi:hypothetical protein
MHVDLALHLSEAVKGSAGRRGARCGEESPCHGDSVVGEEIRACARKGRRGQHRHIFLAQGQQGKSDTTFLALLPDEVTLDMAKRLIAYK